MQTTTQGAACSIKMIPSDSTVSLQPEIDGFLKFDCGSGVRRLSRQFGAS
ncbi:MAG: hypothetical protein WAV72_13940 [Bradyrhizobium sp.]